VVTSVIPRVDIFISFMGYSLPDAPARHTVSITVTTCGVTLTFHAIIRPPENKTPILILKTSGNTTVNTFRNLFQLTSLFQRHFIWNNAWTFSKEINSISEGVRVAFVTFNAANTNRSVGSKICTLHFPHANLKRKPRIGCGMDCARYIAGCAGSC
jgi:hypothetical protein